VQEAGNVAERVLSSSFTTPDDPSIC
jgi:hypothetical protein